MKINTSLLKMSKLLPYHCDACAQSWPILPSINHLVGKLRTHVQKAWFPQITGNQEPRILIPTLLHLHLA